MVIQPHVQDDEVMSIATPVLGRDLTYRAGIVNTIDDSGDLLLAKNLDDHSPVVSAIVRS